MLVDPLAFLGSCFFAAILFCGTFGFEYARSDGHHVVDSLYRTLQLFAITTNLEPGWEINGFLEFARFAAPLFLAAAVVAVILRRGSLRLRLRLQSRSNRTRPRYVLLGFGAINRAFARVLRQQDIAVTAVDRRFDEADRRMARRNGIILIEGDLRNAAVIANARLDHCDRVIIASGDDVANIAVATSVAPLVEDGQLLRSSLASQDDAAEAKRRRYACDARGDPIVHMHLSSARLIEDLSEARDIAFARASTVRSFSFAQEAARELVDRMRPAERARDSGQRRVHLVIVGMGDLGEALLAEAAMASYASGLLPPKITVVDRKPRCDTRDRIKAYRPRLFDRSMHAEAQPDIGFFEADAMNLCFDNDRMLDTIDLETDRPTAWIVCCDDDDVNLAVGLRLELAMHQQKRHPAPIFVRIWSDGRLRGDDVAKSPFALTHTFGSVSAVARKAGVLQPRADRLAMLLHEAYLDEEQKDRALKRLGDDAGPSEIDAYDAALKRFVHVWQDLPENVKDSNRNVARHVPIKLRDLGFDWRGRSDGRLPRIGKPDADFWLARAHLRRLDATASPDESGEQDRILQIARSEHARWMFDRALCGWSPGPRDNRRRRHGDLVAFDDLEQETQERDLTALRVLLSHFSGAQNESLACAYRRKLCSIDLGPHGAIPADAEWRQATELRLVISGGATVFEKTDDKGAAARRATRELADLVRNWSAQQCATRLHFVLHRAVEGALTRNAEHAESQLIRSLTEIAGSAEEGTVCDVTRLYVADRPQD